MGGHLQIIIIVIWIFSTQTKISLPKLLLSHVGLSLPVAVGVLQTSLLQVSFLQLRLPVLHVQILRHARGFVCHLSLALPHLAINDSHLRIVVVHVTPLAIVPVKAEFQKIAPANDSPLVTNLATDGDSLQGIPPLQSDGDSLQRIPIHLSVGTHPVPRLVMVLLRDPHHGLLLPVHLRLLGKIKTLMNLLCLPQFGL